MLDKPMPAADPESTRAFKLKIALQLRPDGRRCIEHLLDLRKAGTKPPPVLPSDVLRRENCLARASRLAKAMPTWPNAPLPEPRELHRGGDGGWSENGPRRIGAKHGPHARRDREVAAAVFDEFGDDDEGED